VKKATLTPTEYRRVETIMGAARTSADGYRRCRCGELVHHTPNSLWEHTLECEMRQQREQRAAESQQAHVDELVAIAGDR